MNFHQALAARYGVRHLWGGGQLGTLASGLKTAGGSLSDNVHTATGSAGKGVADAWHSVIAPNSFTPNMPTNAFNPEMPVNSFQATAPELNTMNFQNGLQGGFSAAATGIGGAQGAAQQQMNTAGQFGGVLAGQQALVGQQQGLADALLAQSRGQGPNPAQMQFQQNMDQAVAQQAGALASTRGLNPALAARMAAQQGAAMQQGAAGNAAVLGAQQQLAAQQQLGQQQQAIANTIAGQGNTVASQGAAYNQAGNTYANVGQLGTSLYGTAAGANNAQNGIISQNSLTAQGLNAGVAQQNAALAAQGQQLKAGVAEQNANLAAQGESLKAGVAGSNAAAQSAVTGGLINAAGGAAAAGIMRPGAAGAAGGAGVPTAGQAPMGTIPYTAAQGGEVPDRTALSLADALMGRGGEVPGKAQVEGDSAENDTVPTVLSPDEIVLPRSVATAEDAPEKAAEFVAKLKGKSSGAKGYGKILEKHRAVQKHMDALEALIKRSA